MKIGAFHRSRYSLAPRHTKFGAVSPRIGPLPPKKRTSSRLGGFSRKVAVTLPEFSFCFSKNVLTQSCSLSLGEMVPDIFVCWPGGGARSLDSSGPCGTQVVKTIQDNFSHNNLKQSSVQVHNTRQLEENRHLWSGDNHTSYDYKRALNTSQILNAIRDLSFPVV